MAFIPYLKTFFAEKDLIEENWTLTDEQGTVHIIGSAVVLEEVANASVEEQNAIANIIRKIDFHNGDVNHFLQHLANALINHDGKVL